MKKTVLSLLSFCCVVSMIFVLSSCSSGGKTPKVSAIVDAITKDYPMSDSMMEVTDENIITNTYGFEKGNYDDIAIYVNNSSVEQDTLIIVKANSSESADTIKELLNNQLTSKLNSTKDYLPDQYEIVKKCEVVQYGDYVGLIISKDAEAMNKLFEEQVK